jgi:redox-sensitive bicupin YhaK (pirin superfamily)
MFPLVDAERPNPLELFQIWLNLPAADKLAEPHFTMFWNEDIPRRSFKDDAGRGTEVTLIAGGLDGAKALAPPPHSWAARAESDVAIWTVRLEAGARWTLPPAAGASTVRTLYGFRATGARIAGEAVAGRTAVAVKGDAPIAIEAAEGETELLLLQGRPIGEPVVAYGPFVMNSRAEIERAFADYRRTRFGGWPWPKEDPVFARSEGRFARHADGRLASAPNGVADPTG